MFLHGTVILGIVLANILPDKLQRRCRHLHHIIRGLPECHPVNDVIQHPDNGFRKQGQESHVGKSEEMTDAPAGKSGFPVGTVVAIENQKRGEIPGIPELS